MAKSPQNPYEDMVARARKNQVSNQIEKFPIGEEVTAVFISSETAKVKPVKGKKGGNADPGQILTLDDIQDVDRRYKVWSFGLLDYLLNEHGIESGDVIVVTKQEKNEKGFWGCDFGFCKVGEK